jgi:hypothetical protein
VPAPRWWAAGAALTAVAVASLAGPREARADEQPAPDWSTHPYAGGAPVYRLRLALEEVGAVAIALVGYSIQDPPPSIPGVPMPIRPWEKLTFQPGTWAFDADDFGTNMVGHPAAGTVYYLIARGNRVSIPEAFAWTLGASLLWELVEYKEPVSLNDQIMAPAGGIAIGEAMTQLSAWFERSGDDAFSKAMAFLFNPARKIHDWIDGVRLERDPRAVGWHEFTAFGGVGALWQSSTGAAYGVAQAGIGSRLFHAPGYGEPGQGRFAFGDGNASRVGLGLTFTTSDVVDFLFDTETALAGLYVREIDGAGGGRSGFDLFLGGTAGYEYGYHRWDLSTGEVNRIALVRLPGVDFRARWFSGPWTVAAGLGAALTFGGVQPFAIQGPAAFPPGTTLLAVMIANGYYYALGFRCAPALEVELGPAAVGGAAWIDLLTGLTSPNVVEFPGRMVQLADQRGLVSAWGRVRVTDTPLEAAVVAQWRYRSGSIDALSRSEREQSVTGRVGVVF